MIPIGNIIMKMTEYYTGDTKRINHFLKVYAFGKAIGDGENLDEDTKYILDAATVVHDIGIKISEEKYHSTAGKYQELFGAMQSKELLTKLGVEEAVVNRVSYLVGHHHTYSKVDGIDYRILIEADFLVNAHEDNLSIEAVRSAKEKIFRTKTGIALLHNLYNA
ncbi:MAG TPA: HD domain-containing protein [Clostridiales bacterium]|nr:HD domain-containing protein [Clostridiales bacterium]